MKSPEKDADTIAAISTPPGKGAIAVVRMSGERSLEIARRLFVTPSEEQPATLRKGLSVGCLRDPQRGRLLDTVILLVFEAPSSYTGEDMVEFQCHGGRVTPGLIMRSLIEAGAREARRGEFTLRAFLNGKLDLIQAEAVADLVESTSELAQRGAVLALEGTLSRMIDSLRDEMLELSARFEYMVDFPEEDDHLEGPSREEGRLDALLGRIDHLLATGMDCEILRGGVLAVIAGAPNVGKSSLFNLLLEKERAIVTPQPGTTRDAIEAEVEIGGLPFLLVDTAGIGETVDPIEKKGIEFSRRYIEGAHIILFVLEANRNLIDDEVAFIEKYGNKCIAIVNKSDLGVRLDCASLSGCCSVVTVSCLERSGIALLKKALAGQASRLLNFTEGSPIVVRARHREALGRARGALERLRKNLGSVPPEFLALELREAREALEELTGVIAGEEILERIFSRFCVGK